MEFVHFHDWRLISGRVRFIKNGTQFELMPCLIFFKSYQIWAVLCQKKGTGAARFNNWIRSCPGPNKVKSQYFIHI